MINLEPFIVKDGNNFYVDLELYHQTNKDFTIEEGDTVKFIYEDKKYIANILNTGGGKHGIFQLKIIH
jgi:hypothetical protein